MRDLTKGKAEPIQAAVNRWRLSLAILFILCIAPRGALKADGVLSRGLAPLRIYEGGTEVRSSTHTYCNGSDLDCASAMLRMTTGFQLARLEFQAGAALPQGSPAGQILVEALHLEMPSIVGDVARFTLTYLPETRGVRILFNLAGVDAAFLCTDRNGRHHVPGIGRAFHNCMPETRLGIGLAAPTIQWDSDTGRFAGRWFVFNVVFDFLGGGHGVQRIKRHLDALLGMNVDTVWQGTTAGASADAQSNLRFFVGVAGMVRSPGSAWEFDADLIFRPAIIGTSGAFQDFHGEGSARLLRHFVLEQQNLTLGLTTAVSYCEDPRNCIGPYSSDRERFSIFVGALFGISSPFQSF